VSIKSFWALTPKNNYEAALIFLNLGDRNKALEHLKLANEIWVNADPNYKPAQEAREKWEELGGE
jgi:hypothetical protein